MAEFEIFKDANLEFRWRFKAKNGKLLAESAERYNNQANCEHAIIWRPFWRHRKGTQSSARDELNLDNSGLSQSKGSCVVVEILRSEICGALDNGLFSGQKARTSRIDPSRAEYR